MTSVTERGLVNDEKTMIVNVKVICREKIGVLKKRANPNRKWPIR